jgi:hypothetical protein
MITVLALIAFSFQSYGSLPVVGPVRSCDFLFCDAPERGRAVIGQLCGPGARIACLGFRLIDLVKLSVDVR